MNNVAERKQFLRHRIGEIDAKDNKRRIKSSQLFLICLISLCVGLISLFVGAFFGSLIAWMITAGSFLWGLGGVTGFSRPDFYERIDLESRLDELQKLDSA